MNILFISTSNFATDPRLVKEIDLALNNNYEVSVICFSFNNWSKLINDKIIERFENKITCYLIPGNQRPFFPWLLSSVLFSFSSIALKIFPAHTLLLSLRSNKRSWLLLRHLKSINNNADLIVAHNPGSFYPAMKFARGNNIPFAADLEDYHPGETNNQETASHLKRLSQRTLSKAAYLSAASPLILQYTLGDIHNYEGKKMVIMNWFPSDEFQPSPEINIDKLRLVWFSQNIAEGRGLEEIIPAFKNFEPAVELHLYGNMKEEFFYRWIEGAKNVIVHSPVPQKELHMALSAYDVGLAIEPGKDLNNKLAISNKMLAYIQSGLYILATETIAQKEFLLKHPSAGKLTRLGSNSFMETLNYLNETKEKLRYLRSTRFLHAKEFSWESESEQLLQTWKESI